MILAKILGGPQLADLGPSPLGAIFLIFGSLMIVMTVVQSVFEGFHLGQSLVNLVYGAYFCIFGATHSQLLSRGIYVGGRMAPYNRITHFEWSGTSVLTVELKRKWWWRERLQLPVPSSMVEPVDRMIRERTARVAGMDSGKV